MRPVAILSLFLAPVVFASGAGQNARHSLGTAVFGGMFVSTLLNLFFIPILYVLVESFRERRKVEDPHALP